MANQPWPAAVVADRLTKTYGAFRAVNEVSFQVRHGEVFALLGPNGAGKTSIIEVLEGFRSRDGGRVEVLGLDPAARSTQRALRQRIGVVLQELAVEPFLTVREVLQRSASYYPDPRDVDDVLDVIGLGEKARARVKNLSGGQQRRLDLGLGIVGNPELLFLDEPTTGFDPSARRGAWDVIRALVQGGTTVILTTHYMDEAEALADRLAVIARGQIVATGTPQSIGGRDLSEASIRFRLPHDVRLDELPASLVATAEGPTEEGWVRLHVNDDVAAMHALTGWALDNCHQLAGLSLSRLTLEDIYLRLTAPTRDASAPTAARPVEALP